MIGRENSFILKQRQGVLGPQFDDLDGSLGWVRDGDWSSDHGIFSESWSLLSDGLNPVPVVSNPRERKSRWCHSHTVSSEV